MVQAVHSTGLGGTIHIIDIGEAHICYNTSLEEGALGAGGSLRTRQIGFKTPFCGSRQDSHPPCLSFLVNKMVFTISILQGQVCSKPCKC